MPSRDWSATHEREHMSRAAWRVIAPGSLTTVQDRGRDGWRHLGVGRAGALDPASAALANRMVGNPSDAAVLEITLIGPTLELLQPARIALCGAAIDARFEDAQNRVHTIPCGRPVDLPAGLLRLGAIRSGLRAWLAVAGGFDVPRVLGSRSTDLRGGFGGLHGRALRSGDALPLGPQPMHDLVEPQAPAWWIALDTAPANASPIRYVAAGIDAAHALARQDWRVDPRSDRQGLRCSGAPIVAALSERISAPVAPGTLQLPPDGQPIVLLADAQTVGGYPRLGHVVCVDLPRLAQLRAGDALRFEAITADAATLLRRKRDAELARALLAIDDRLRRA